jgi:hypothetical protein
VLLLFCVDEIAFPPPPESKLVPCGHTSSPLVASPVLPCLLWMTIRSTPPQEDAEWKKKKSDSHLEWAQDVLFLFQVVLGYKAAH